MALSGVPNLTDQNLAISAVLPHLRSGSTLAGVWLQGLCGLETPFLGAAVLPKCLGCLDMCGMGMHDVCLPCDGWWVYSAGLPCCWCTDHQAWLSAG